MSDFFESKWTAIKDQVRQTWSKLTDEDMEKLNGDFEELSTRIQRVYGYGKDQAKQEIEKFKKGLTN